VVDTDNKFTDKDFSQESLNNVDEREVLPQVQVKGEIPQCKVLEYKGNDTAKRVGVTFTKIRKKLNPVWITVICALVVLSVIISMLTVAVFRLSAKIDDINGSHRGIYDGNSSGVVLAGKSDRIHTYNPAYGYVAIPAIEGVPVSNYKDENFKTDANGYKYYYENGELCSYLGIDVSEYNGSIDWQRVRDAGVEFVMLRVGGRGWGSEGIIFEDAMFRENLRGAKSAGLKVGAYFYSQAINAQEAEEEAEFVLSVLEGEELEYPIAFDWEKVDGISEARTHNIDPDILTECAVAFCDRIKEADYTPSLYAGSELAYYKYDLAQLSDVDIWYAFYNDTPGLYYNYMMWQYTSEGVVDGVSGSVDLNICFKNYK